MRYVLAIAVAITAFVIIHGTPKETPVAYLDCPQSLYWYHTHADALGVATYPAAAEHGLDWCMRAMVR